MTSDLINHQHTTQTLFLLSMIFLSAATAIVLFILVSRTVKNARQASEAFYLSTLQPSINKLIFLDEKIPEASYTFSLKQINSTISGNRQATQVFINQLVNMKKNLSGTSANIVVNLYHDLKLFDFSIRKLSSWSWDKRAEGIRELSELNHVPALQLIPKLAKTKNKTLRKELLLSTIRLDKQNPLGFLEQWDDDINAWMQIHIHHYLLQSSIRTLPDFSLWFNSTKDSIVIFAITMAQQFQQSSAVPGLVNLLSHPNPLVVKSSIDALTKLEAFSVVDQVAAIADTYWANNDVSIPVVRFISKTAHSTEHTRLLERYLQHRSLTVKLEAVRGLLSTKPGVLTNYTGANEEEIRRLVAHTSEPLLQ